MKGLTTDRFRLADWRQNIIRKYNKRHQWDYRNTRYWREDGNEMRKQVDHCIEHLRQEIMCLGETTLYLTKWEIERGEDVRIVSDMGSWHKCRDLEKLRKWAGRNSVDGIGLETLAHA
jgi:hypothetical protein